MRIKSRKGILLTLVTIVLFVLMLAELITYVVININYSNLGTAASVTLSTGAFTQSLSSGTSLFMHDSLRRALNALVYYEGNATLRKGNFVNNTALELESLMNNGTIYGSSVLNGYMNGYTLVNFTNSIVVEAAKQNMELNINNASIAVYQDSPFTLNVSYTALAVLNSTEGTITYPIHAKGSVSLNGTMDLYSVESGNPQQINVMNNSLVTIVGNTRAVSGSKSTFMFVYGTLLVEPSGIVCSSIPAQYRNINYILATSNAADVNQSVCNMGGLVTNVTNSSTPLKPYLVYSNSANIFNYLQNGTKVLLSGSSLSLLNISGLKTAYDNNYYYSSLSSPSYLDSAESFLSQSSAGGIFSISNINRYVAGFNGASNISIGASSILAPTTHITVAAWVQPMGTQVAYSGVISKGNSDSYELFTDANEYFGLQVINSVDNWGYETAVPFTAGKWYYVAMTYNSTSASYSLYVNGVSQSITWGGGGTGTGPIIYTTGSTVIGAWSGTNTRNFNGAISNIQVYNTTLSASQIQQLYQEGISGVPASDAGLVGWWPLDGNSNDYSGNNNNGTPTNILYSNLNNYVGNPLKYGAIYNPYDYMTVAGFGCNNVASCNSSSLSMPSSAYVLPLTLKNSQSTAAPAPFQQMITFNPSAYSAYEASNLGNIRFYQNGTELYSWCESGCSTASSNATFWVRLPNGIPANSNITISMVFGTTSANYDGVYAGEAPQLSPTYGEYDNGQNVFNIYGAFGNGFDGWSPHLAYGTFTPKFISAIGAIQLINTTGEGTELFPPNNGRIPKVPTIVEASYQQNEFTSSGYTSDGDNMGIFGNTSSLQGISLCGNAGGNQVGAGASYLQTEPIQSTTCSFGAGLQGSGVSTASSGPSYVSGYYYWYLITSPSVTKGGYLYSASSPYSMSDISSLYSVPSSQNATYSIGTTFSYPDFSFGAGSGGGYMDQYVYWIVGRTYPPNGMMPSVTFGKIIPYSPSPSQNALDSINGALLPDAAVFNGASGYVGIPGSSSPNLPSSATVSMWIYPYANTSTYSNIEGKGTGQPFIQLYHVNQIYQVIAGIWGVGQTARATIPSKAWSFITATYSPTSNTVTVYINGAYALNSTMPGGISSNTNPLQLGSTSPTFSNGGYFNGSMVDVQLYNTTLSTSQVRELYLNNSVSGISSISYWPLNGGIGGLMNVTPNLVSGSSYGQLYSGSTICTNADVINGVCGVNYATLSGK